MYFLSDPPPAPRPRPRRRRTGRRRASYINMLIQRINIISNEH